MKRLSTQLRLVLIALCIVLLIVGTVKGLRFQAIQVDDFFAEYHAKQLDLHSPSQSQPTPRILRLDPSILPTGGIVLLSLGITTAGILFIFKRTALGKYLTQSTIPLKSYRPIPCRNCQYFTQNQYLQCAVNPLIVLTERAKDCSDYCPGCQGEQEQDETQLFDGW